VRPGRPTWAAATAVCGGLAVLASGAVARAAPAPAAAAHQLPVARFALIVGVNRCVDARMALLRYADDDAIRYDELFATLGSRTFLLTRADDNTRRIFTLAAGRAAEPRWDDLGRTLATIATEVAAAHARGARTVFYFIYAGHGNRSKGVGYLALEDARLTSADVEHGIVDRVRADESHLIIDACYSSFLSRARGPGGVRRRFENFLPKQATSKDAAKEGLEGRADVGLLLSTSSARESHEWDQIQAGVFSHEVRSGLFGAADYNGDGQVSYDEIAAFIESANAAIPNERFRPDTFTHPPARSAELLDLRAAGTRHLRVDGEAQAGHYFLDDSLGNRRADFHNAPGHGMTVLLPRTSGKLLLRRARDDREFEIPSTPDLVSLAELSPHDPKRVRGDAGDEAFSLIFSLPFDEAAFTVARRTAEARLGAADSDSAPVPPLPRWRVAGGIAGAGVATAALIAGTALTWSARSLADDARHASSQQRAAALNDRMSERLTWSRVSYGLAGAAALTSALMLLWPRGDLYASGDAGGDLAMLQVGGKF
jgi:hypothetical protein